MSDEIRYCKDCMWLQPARHPAFDFEQCERVWTPARYARATETLCGPEGRYWAPKEE